MPPTNKKLAQPFGYVNMTEQQPVQLAFPGMTQHKDVSIKPYILIPNNDRERTRAYGVSKSRRVLSPGLLLKKWDQVRKCLGGPLGFTNTQQCAVLRLLRLWSYYGLVYPKASQIAQEPEISEEMAVWRAEQGFGPAPGSFGCSRSTFWRTIKKLQKMGLIEVVNRFIFREHAQISNLYRLDNLIIVIARYLAEKGRSFKQGFLRYYLNLPSALFWSLEWLAPGRKRGRNYYNDTGPYPDPGPGLVASL